MNETPRTDAMNEQKIITELYEALERIAGASKRYFEEQPVGLREAYDETYMNPFEQAQQALKNAKKLFEPEL